MEAFKVVELSGMLPRTVERSPSPATIDSSHPSSVRDAGELSVLNSSRTSKKPIKVGSKPPYVYLAPWKKRAIVVILVFCAAHAALSAFMFYPISPDIAIHLRISPKVIDKILMCYASAQAIGPAIWSPIADVYGRRHILIISVTLYSIASLLLLLTNSATCLMVFRFCQAFFSTMVIAIGSGVIADITTSHERGGYIGIFLAFRQLYIVVGPIISGSLAQRFGWHSVFGFLSLIGFASIIAMLLFLPETKHGMEAPGSLWERLLSRPIFQPLVIDRESILASRAQQARVLDNTPSGTPSRGSVQVKRNQTKLKLKTLLKHYQMQGHTLFRIDILWLVLYAACVNATVACITTSIPRLLKPKFNLSTEMTGLCFLANGIGSFLGSVDSGRKLDRDFSLAEAEWCLSQARGSKTSNDCDVERSTVAQEEIPLKMSQQEHLPASFPLERTRYEGVMFHTLSVILSTLIYGWGINSPPGTATIREADEAAASEPTVLVPLLAQFTAGYSAAFLLSANGTLLVDLLPETAAIAAALGNLVRFGVEAIVLHEQEAILQLGSGWASCVMAAMSAVAFVPLVLTWIWGHKWRAYYVAKNKRLAEKKAKLVPPRFMIS